MAENDKNYDRFYKIYKVRTYASSTGQTFPGIVGTGILAPVDISASPMVTWTLQVTGVPGTATTWTIALEGSVDGVAYSEILKHTTLTGNGVPLFSGTTLFLANYYRINVIALSLGVATSVSVTVVGKQ